MNSAFFFSFLMLFQDPAFEPSMVEALGTRDALTEVTCPECDDFETRMLEVLKDERGAMQQLRSYKKASGVVTSSYSPDRLKAGLIPLYEERGYTIMELDARLMNPEKGGTVILSWVGNVLFGSGRGSIRFMVQQDAAGDWGLQVAGKKVSSLVITPASYGVERVEAR